MGRIYVVGLGPGKEEYMTYEAAKALEESDVIIGYTVYIDLIKDRYQGKELLTTGMRQEKARCSLCLSKALEGKTVSLVCSGDSGVYGMASLMLEIAEGEEVDIKVISGITAALSGGAVLGAPLSHDFCVISLSDHLTPWELIEKRLRCAAMGDFAMAIYNPSSKMRKDYLKRACDILLEVIEKERVCGFVRNIGRDDESYCLCTLEELKDKQVDMFTTVFIGNSTTKVIDGRLVTPRGYLKND
ncbi:precorrin-3B C(17)-methyltransferase [Butyrivibrio sp. FCS014]|uniref:precorrin-3B C(17)-methyltransferase n=1 Tax=Butyrivibrio sp. FCS014 TaxID=1408304 RepID=UPI00046618A1|nr:precorrin-3B C(17)-methyltransferase [Butyrivibrio sp. FCS014]